MKTYSVTFRNNSSGKQNFHLIRFDRTDNKATIVESILLSSDTEKTIFFDEASDIGVTTGSGLQPGDTIKQDYLPNSCIIDVSKSSDIIAVFTEINTWKLRPYSGY